MRCGATRHTCRRKSLRRPGLIVFHRGTLRWQQVRPHPCARSAVFAATQGFHLKIIQGITYRQEALRLDGKHFVDCVFQNCDLEYSGGDLILERSAIHGCRHLLFGDARRTAQYMRTVGLCDNTAGKWTEWTGVVN